MQINRRLLRCLAPLAAVGLLPVLAVTGSSPPAQAAAPSPTGVRATLGGFPVWAHFANPLAAGGRDETIHNEVVRLIDNTAKGATIRGTIHSLSVPAVSRALVAAQARGVLVAIAVDGKNATSAARAVEILKQLPPKSYTFCTYPAAAYESPRRAGRSCISTSDNGDLHTKIFTFTQTTDPTGATHRAVSWIGSANMTYASGSDQFNNAVTVYGDRALWNGLNANFADVWARTHIKGNDYYDAEAGRGYYRAGAGDAYASPQGRGQSDTIATRLNDLSPDSRCQLRIAMNFVTDARPALTKVIKGFRAKGCRVALAVGGSARRGIEADKATYRELIKAGVSIRRTPDVHDKFFLAYGKFGSRYEYHVYTGSQNWSGSALNTNDEIFVKLAPETTSHPLYDGYYAHYSAIWAAGRACTTGNFPCR